VRGEGWLSRQPRNGERFMERYARDAKEPGEREVVVAARSPRSRRAAACGPEGDYLLLKLDISAELISIGLPRHPEIARSSSPRRSDPRSDPRLGADGALYMAHPDELHGAVVGAPKAFRAEEASVPGLSPPVNCSCVSVHGANGLGRNSLLEPSGVRQSSCEQ